MQHLDPASFRDRLTSLAREVGDGLRRARQRQLRAAALPTVSALLAVVPLGYLLLCLILRGGGLDFAVPIWAVALCSLVPPALYYGYWASVRVKAVTDAAALSRIDDALELQDRLTAAREFLDAPLPSPFMQAAIRDAQAHAERARHFRAEEPAAVVARLGWRHGLGPLLALLALLATGWVEVRLVGGGGDVLPRRQGAVETAVADHTIPDTDRRRRTAARPARPPRANEPSTDASERGDASLTGKDKKTSRGTEGRGKSSKAQSSSGQSAGEGEATDQAQPTKGGEKHKPKPRADKPSVERPRKKTVKQPRDDKDSVASSGRGKGKGSSRSPTASDWSSREQSVADDEEELEDDDDVDDEDEESEARGGLQPNLRQRKPPVNRDLTLGFGGGKPPPHANGRGGPGLPKKQRGVAQLVLGIPFPDQISGKPNPGRTKITQERIDPQAQQADSIAAESRRRRASPLGHLSRPLLRPWMQDLIRDFQLSLDQTGRQIPGRQTPGRQTPGRLTPGHETPVQEPRRGDAVK